MCYLVPAGGAIISSLIWRKKKETKVGWLNLMFLGGAIFGIVDHAWNGELFTSGNIVKDLSLGVAISLSILVSWVIVLRVS
ncbi:MAG: hypothetical protein Q8R48_04770, partial [Candidatus Omnitrophota bacterium]|nr:hypothetical protein [Candidatus Omnitrophota bacterium]